MAPLISGHRGRWPGCVGLLSWNCRSKLQHSILMVCRVLSCSAQLCRSCRLQHCSHKALLMAGKLYMCVQLVLRCDKWKTVVLRGQ